MKQVKIKSNYKNVDKLSTSVLKSMELRKKAWKNLPEDGRKRWLNSGKDYEMNVMNNLYNKLKDFFDNKPESLIRTVIISKQSKVNAYASLVAILAVTYLYLDKYGAIEWLYTKVLTLISNLR